MGIQSSSTPCTRSPTDSCSKSLLKLPNLISHIQAMDYVGQVAKQVTGRLFITVLRNSTDISGQPKLEEVRGATMSGFWLDKTKFMTCAHFLETVRGTNGDETETFLKAPNPERPRAFVSNKKRAVGLNVNSRCTTLRYLLSKILTTFRSRFVAGVPTSTFKIFRHRRF